MPSQDKGLAEVLETALAEWLHSEGGGFVAGSIIVVDFVDCDGEQRWAYATSDGQKMTTTMGLSAWLQGIVRYEQSRYHQAEDEQQAEDETD